MAKNAKMDALSKILDEAKDAEVEVEMGGEESSDKCRCGAGVKCDSCGEAPSTCDC